MNIAELNTAQAEIVTGGTTGAWVSIGWLGALPPGSVVGMSWPPTYPIGFEPPGYTQVPGVPGKYYPPGYVPLTPPGA